MKMVYRILLLLLFLNSSMAYCQEENESLRNILIESFDKLPYRDFSSSYKLNYDSLSSRHSFIHHMVLDSAILEKLNEKLNCYLHQTNDTQNYEGVIRFDNYTDNVFVSLKNQNTNVFYAVESIYQPPGGMKKFVERWCKYVDSLNSINEFDYNEINDRTYVYFFVGNDSRLLTSDKSPFASLVNNFIKKEKNWYLGIQSGRAGPIRVDLKVPNSSGSEHRIDFKIQTKVRESDIESPIYYRSTLSYENQPNLIVSAVNDHGKYTAFVLHIGTTNERDELVHFMTNQVNKPTISSEPDFRRIYFYKTNH